MAKDLTDEEVDLAALLLGESSWLFTYDEEWNILTQTDMMGQTWTFTYDSIGLLTEVDPHGTTYVYDETGLMVSMTRINGETELL